MDKFIEGIQRFRSTVVEVRRQVFERLAAGQKPQALLITCSDSRIQPDRITMADPGDIFVLRNVGNIVPPHGCGQTEAEAVVEYAVVALGVEHIIVCGHSHCGAMQALLHPEHLRELPTVASWLIHAEQTKARVLQKYGHLSGPDLLEAAIRENVLVQMERVRELPCVAPRLADGRVRVHGWIYRIESGEVLCFCHEDATFASIEEVMAAHTA